MSGSRAQAAPNPTRCPVCHVVFPAQCRNERGEKLLNLTGRHGASK